MSDDATGKGASEEQSQVIVSTSIDRRSEAMAEIIARAAAERQADIEDQEAMMHGEPVDDSPPPDEEAMGEEVAVPVVEQAKGKQVQERPGEELIKIVVDGEEREVPLSQVRDAGIRTLQKQSAADKRLEDATRLLREAQAAAAEPRPSADDADAEESPATVDADDELKQLAYAIQMGDEEESAAALRKLEQRMRTPRQEIDRIIEEQLQAREILSRFEAPVDKGGFADLWSDPVLKRKAIEESDRLLKEGSPNTWDTYNKAGETVRQWLREKAGVNGGSDGAPRIVVSEGKKQKHTIDSLVGAGGRSEPTTVQKPRSPQEIIADIKRMRGQI